MNMSLAINGFGRIGRSLFRAIWERGLQRQLQINAINELADLPTIAYLTEFDSTHGRFSEAIAASEGKLAVGSHAIPVTHWADIGAVTWRDIDVVVECSGSFDDRATAARHIEAGAKGVLFSQPAQADVDATLVYGVNHHSLSQNHTIVSAASCTTNAVVPVIAALDEALGIEAGVITTIHSAMNDQPVLDSYHNTDLRKTRAAFNSIIPVETGLARGIGRVLPHLADRFEAQAMRVPTLNVSAIDLSITVRNTTDRDAVNRILQQAAASKFSGVLGYTTQPLASCDFNHNPLSGTVDASQTRVSGGKLVKVLIWFDNEWGYANRLIDLLLYWQQQDS